MIKFTQTLKSWQSTSFIESLKQDIKNLKPGILPLQKATSQGGYIDDSDLSTTILNYTEKTNAIMINIGLFFTEIVPSCSCGDDPMEINAYCELQIAITKSDAQTTFILINNSHYSDI